MQEFICVIIIIFVIFVMVSNIQSASKGTKIKNKYTIKILNYMKKIFLLMAAILLMGCCPCHAQSTVNFPTKRMVAVNPQTDTVVLKDTVKELTVLVAKQDSVLQAQQDTIKTKVQENKNLRENIGKNLLGGLSKADLISAFILAFLGMFIRWAYRTLKAVKTNEQTPNKFNLNYFIQSSAHKLMRVMANLAVAYIFFIFCRQLLGMELTMIIAFFIGLFIDYLADYLMALKPNAILTPKDIKTEPQTNNNSANNVN